jgi:type IV pilus assembly protein PilA
MKSAAHQKGFTLIELLVVIGILAILFSIVLIAINPARQFNQANDTKRRSDTLQILNAIHQYAAENSGNLPRNVAQTIGMPVVPTAAPTPVPPTPYEVKNGTIASPDVAANICDLIMPKYISALPADPEVNNGQPITSCTSYDTGYQVTVDSDGRVTVMAPHAKLGTIAVTR